MSEPRLFIRSERAQELAIELAELEKKTVDEIVEQALEAYRARREPAAAFYARMAAATDEEDIDLDAVIREARRPHTGPDL